ncbi:MAG: outer membrane protein assembly factor BamA [Victivallaceae bacterium]
MRKIFFFTLSLAFFLTSISCYLVASDIQNDPVVVTDIEVLIESPQGLKKTHCELKTRRGEIFSQSDFDVDLKTLSKQYDYIDPVISVDKGLASIHVTVREKPEIGMITIRGNKNVSDTRILKILKISKDELFDKIDFLENFDKLKTFYLKKGYFESNISYKINYVNSGIVNICLDINEGCCGKIKEIRVFGVSKKEQNDIRELIFVKKYSPLLSWFDGSGLYHPEMGEQDNLCITNYFLNKGYADAEVTSFFEAKGNSVIFVINVDKGSQYRLGHIHIEGNKIFSKKQLDGCLLIGPKSLYSPDLVWEGAQKLKELYEQKGYVNASVDVRFNLREDDHVYDVCYQIDEGTPYKVGLVKITGNTQTKQEVILHESSLFPGETFDRIKIESTENRLRNTSYFKTVNVYSTRSQLNPVDENEEYRDIYIEVAETSTGNIGLFLGFSSLDNFFGGVELSESNFNLSGLTSILKKGPKALRGGGEFLYLKANIGGKLTDYSLKWTKPHFFDTPWIFGAEIERAMNKALSTGYDVQTYGGNTSLTYVINRYLKYGFYYRGNQSSLHVKKNNPNPSPSEDDNKGFLSGLGLNFALDSTDSFRNPKQGVRGKLNLEVAGLGGKYHFLKTSFLGSLYRKITDKGILKLRGEIQFIQPYADTTANKVPISERFFLGGETTVRGFKPFSIGPKYSANEPMGGISSLLISEEIQHPLISKPCVNAFVFLDAGYVSLKPFHLSRHISASSGFGVRFEVMQNVPIMLGLGWPFNPTEILEGKKINNSQRFFFALGGIF